MYVQILTIVLPVFILIALGYGSARTGFLGEEVGTSLGQFVFTVAIPVLIFRTLATSSFDGVSPWGLWFAYFTGVAITWTCATLIIRRVFKREARAGVIAGITAGFANTVLVAVPLVTSLYGEAGLVPVFILISVHMPVMTVACAVLMERAVVLDGAGAGRAHSEIFKSVILSLITNPIVIGIAAGALWRVLNLPISGIFSDVLERLAATAIPIALFSLGMSMVRYGVRGNVAPALILSALKGVAMPAIVYVMAKHVVGLPELWVAAATLTAACPTGVNAFIFANRYGTGHAMSANSITFTTASAVVTTFLWAALLT